MNPNTLWASVVWGAIGSGFAIYGKKQGKPVPMIGGLVMIGSTYFCESALTMSVIGVAVTAGIWWLTQRGVGDG
ncbi:MAG: hypothetical protein RLZZ265_1751 [Verrucomicrobiota bacterium]